MENNLPKWVVNLEEEDLSFIKKFVLSSGSLKDLAKMYEISYPTLRLRLDKLIEKIKIYDEKDTDYFIDKIKSLAIDEKIDLKTVKDILNAYRKVKKND